MGLSGPLWQVITLLCVPLLGALATFIAPALAASRSPSSAISRASRRRSQLPLSCGTLIRMPKRRVLGLSVASAVHSSVCPTAKGGISRPATVTGVVVLRVSSLAALTALPGLWAIAGQRPATRPRSRRDASRAPNEGVKALFGVLPPRSSRRRDLHQRCEEVRLSALVTKMCSGVRLASPP